MTELSRREVLKRSLGVSAALAGAHLLSACSGSTTQAPASKSSTSGGGSTGGTLQIGITGSTSADTLNPLQVVSGPDYARAANIFDPLVAQDRDGKPKLVLAAELTPNADATQWTLRLRKGVKFHDGRELTADDVIYTFRQIANPKAPGVAAVALASIDIKGVHKQGNYVVIIPCKTPFATLIQALAIPGYSSIIPVGFNQKKPIGTGPFKLEGFQPGTETSFVKNPNYWMAGRPFLDRVVMRNYSDEISQLNALLAGQVSAITSLTADSVAQVKSSGKQIVVSEGGGFVPFTMRVDTAPFADVRVRQALRLAVDRPQMRDLVYGGHGLLGNDVFGVIAPEYDAKLPQRVRDLQQAKSLLKAAGRQDLSIELITAPIAPGAVKAAQVMAQQAGEAGIKVRLKQLTSSELFGPQFLKWPFASTFWLNCYYLPNVALATLPNSVFNETSFRDPTYAKLYKQAVATVDENRRNEIASEMQTIDYQKGGYVLPVFTPVIDGMSSSVKGVEPTKSGLPLNNYTFTNISLGA